MMDFSKALIKLKEGKRVKRAIWNDNQFIVLQKAYPDGIFPNEQTQKAWDLTPDELFRCMPYFQIKNADGSHSMYQFTNDDIISSDWSVN